MTHFTLPIDDYTLLDDIAQALSHTVKTKQSIHRTIIRHENYSQTMHKLAELIFARLVQDLADTCKQFNLLPVEFTNASFNPKICFNAISNTDPDTLGALVFAKFWHLDKVYNNSLNHPVDSSYDYFWYNAFADETFRKEVLDLFLPLITSVEPKEETVSVTYEMIFKNQNTLDVPKHIYEQGRDAVISYFQNQAKEGIIDLTYSQFSHEVVRPNKQ